MMKTLLVPVALFGGAVQAQRVAELMQDFSEWTPGLNVNFLTASGFFGTTAGGVTSVCALNTWKPDGDDNFPASLLTSEAAVDDLFESGACATDNVWTVFDSACDGTAEGCECCVAHTVRCGHWCRAHSPPGPVVSRAQSPRGKPSLS